MENKKLEEFGKGDIDLYFEICVERSTTEKGVTITLWKNQKGKYQVGICYDKGELEILRFNRDDGSKYDGQYQEYDGNGTWLKYEEGCDYKGCLPYPKADDYRRRRDL